MIRLQAIRKNKKFYISIGIAFFLFFIVIGIIFAQFHRSLKDMELEKNAEILEKISAQNSQTVKAVLDTSLNDMQAMTKSIIAFEKSFDERIYKIDIGSILKNFYENTLFSYMGIADKNGMAKTTTGKVVNVKEEVFFQYAINGVSNTSSLLKEPLRTENEFVNAVPLYNEKEVAGVLYGAYDVESFSRYVKSVETAKEYYFGIIQQNGEFVVYPKMEEAMFFEKNFWNSMKLAELSYPIESIQKDMKDNQSGMIDYTIKGEKRYLYYEPYQKNGWYIISIMNPKEMEYRLQEINYAVWQLLIKVVFALMLIAFWILYWVRKSRSEMEQINRILRQNETSFAIAVSQGAQVIFDYDIETKQLIFRYRGNEKYGFERQLENMPDNLIEKGIVLADSAEAFRQMFQNIAQGEKTASCLVRMKKHDGNIAWDKMVMTNIFSKDGKIIQTVGILEDTTKLKENEKQMAEEMEFHKAMVSNSIASYEINITKDCLIRRTAEEMNTASAPKKKYNYTKCLKALVKYTVYQEDNIIVLSGFSRENMFYAFKRGRRDISRQFRQKLKTGEYIWVECAVHMFQDTLSNDVKGFMVIRNINRQKGKELKLKKQADIDFLTNIYNRATVEKLITKVVSKEEEKIALHAFLICDLDNFKAINDILGHQMGDKTLVDTAQLLKNYFRKTDIIGRLGGDEFIILMQNVDSIEAVKKSLQKLVKQLDRVYGEGEKQVRTTASIGVSISPLQGKTFECLYEKADKALYYVKQHGKNNFTFFE